MNMVSSLYLDPTIGNFINVVVVRIILVEEDDAEVRANLEIRIIFNYLLNAPALEVFSTGAVKNRKVSRKQFFSGRK